MANTPSMIHDSHCQSLVSAPKRVWRGRGVNTVKYSIIIRTYRSIQRKSTVYIILKENDCMMGGGGGVPEIISS